MDYEKILESLKICSEVGTSCEGCSGRGERHCIANLTKAAAIAIETLLHALDMAKRERDVVTKRMIELDQENVTNRNGLNEPLTMDDLRKMDGEPAWFVSLRDGFASWGIVRVVEMSKVWFVAVAGAERAFGELDGYGKTWLAYRQKPEDGTV